MTLRSGLTLAIILAGTSATAAQERSGLRGQKTIFGEWFQPGAPAGEKTPLASDRPDFTESSTNVGRGRLQIEMGYTYFYDRNNGVTTQDHTYPELLLRYGIFADWLELRIGHSFGQTSTDSLLESTDIAGAQDLYLGLGVALFEQRGIFPELKVNFQAFVPAGSRDVTAGEMLPGVNVLYGWDVIEDKWTVGASSQINRRANDVGGFYLEAAQSLTNGIGITEKLGYFAETFAFWPSGSHDPGIGPEYYFDSGFTYLFRENIQFDIRAGVGLNRHATDFFTGAGLVMRY